MKQRDASIVTRAVSALDRGVPGPCSDFHECTCQEKDGPLTSGHCLSTFSGLITRLRTWCCPLRAGASWLSFKPHST